MPNQLYGKKKATSTKKQETDARSVAPLEQPPSSGGDPGEQAEPAAGEHAATVQAAETVDAVLPSRAVSLAELPVNAIIPSRAQAREEENLTSASLTGLVASMQEHGILSRIRVRPVEGRDDLFELVFGERRWRAARLAGYTHYPVEIASYTDDELEEVGLIENIQRQDLTALEEAKKYQRLLALQDEHGQPKYSLRKLATRIGKDKSYLEMRLAVLRSAEDVQQLVKEQPQVPLRAVYEISKVEDQEKREDIIADVREGKLKKVEEVKSRVREARGQVPLEPSPMHPDPPVPPVPVAEVTVLPQHQEEQREQPSALPDVPLLQQEVTPAGTKGAAPETTLIPDPREALIVFERHLYENNAVITDIVQHLASQVEILTATQREVLIVYLDRWGKALMELRTQARKDENV